MEKMSLWKRMGGWFQRSQTSGDSLEVIHHDAEGLIVEPAGENCGKGHNSAMATRGDKKELQLTALEGSFNRLVEVLESLNANVEQQHQQNTELITRFGETGGLMKTLPENIQSQNQAVSRLTDEIQNQSLHNRQIIEIVKSLPQINQEQVDRLGQIVSSMETSIESDAQMVESFNRFDANAHGMLNSSKAQATSLANMGEMLERNEKRLHELMNKQSSRYIWLLVIVLVLSLAGIGAVAALLLYGFYGAQ